MATNTSELSDEELVLLFETVLESKFNMEEYYPVGTRDEYDSKMVSVIDDKIKELRAEITKRMED